MRQVTRTVYYCDYCGKHRISRPAMEKHEASCTMNPARLCRWRIDGHSDGQRIIEIAPIAARLAGRAVGYPTSADPEADERTYLTRADIAWLRGEVDGCPVCMLAALRQSRVDEWHLDRELNEIFNYGTEVERLRAEEREAAEVW